MSIWSATFEKIDAINEQKKQVFTGLESVKCTGEQSLNFAENLPNYHESINSTKARLIAAIKLFKSVQSSDRSTALIPMFYLNEWDESLTEIEKYLNIISDGLSRFDASGGISSIDVPNFIATGVDPSIIFNFSTNIQAIDTKLDHALASFYRIHTLFQRPDYSKFEAISDSFKNAFDEISEKKDDLLKLIKESKDLKGQISAVATYSGKKKTEVENIHNKILALEEDIDVSAKEISTTKASVAEMLPSIEETNTATANLKKIIDAYQPQFGQFQEQLDVRVAKYKEGNEKLDILIKSLNEQENEIERINKEASAALNFATVAGLAKGFEDRKDALHNELSKTYKWFVGSVVSLFICTLPFAIYIVGSIFQWWSTRELNYEYGVVLLLLAVPAAIMMRFTSGGYNKLFRLREQYAHKFSIAFSMDGFRRSLQEDKQNQIVATTFAQLSSNNPADCIDNKTTSEEHPLPIWNKFLDLFFNKK